MVKNPPTNAGMQETQFQSLCQEEPWGRKWQLASAFLPGKFHGERSLVGYSPWDHKESGMIEKLSTHTHTHTTREHICESLEMLNSTHISPSCSRSG